MASSGEPPRSNRNFVEIIVESTGARRTEELDIVYELGCSGISGETSKYFVFVIRVIIPGK